MILKLLIACIVVSGLTACQYSHPTASSDYHAREVCRESTQGSQLTAAQQADFDLRLAKLSPQESSNYYARRAGSDLGNAFAALISCRR